MRIKNKSISIIYKFIICLIAFISLVFTTGILDNNFNLKIFTMFTTLSNILVFIYYLIDIFFLNKNRDKDIGTWSPLFKGIISLNIIVTFLVAMFVLKMGFSFKSYFELSLLGLHYIVPIMTVFDYILFDKKGESKYYYPFIWLICPFLYLIVAVFFAHFSSGFGTSLTSHYPYPFMDVTVYGLKQVVITYFIMGLIFFSIGLLVVSFDKLIKKNAK